MTAEFAHRNQGNKHLIWDFWQRMNHATPQQMPRLIKDTFHTDVDWNGPHPINQLKGTDALITEFWEPFLRSFPDLQRDAQILMGGISDEEEWVSGMGYLTGTFVEDWLGIPATGQKTNVHFGQFFVIREGKVAESYLILDILEVMKQAGFQVLPPALGREGGKVQRPEGGDGLLLMQQDPLQSNRTKQLVLAMISGLMRYDRERDREAMSSMEQWHYWHPFFHWMGPTGIGTSHTIEEFQDFHQRPWLLAFGDRLPVDEKRGGRLMGFFGEGNYGCLGIWDSKFSRHHGEYQGVPATGRMLTLRDFDWYKRDGTLLIQNWVPIDMLDLFKQMGVDLFARMRHQLEERKRGNLWFAG